MPVWKNRKFPGVDRKYGERGETPYEDARSASMRRRRKTSVSGHGQRARSVRPERVACAHRLLTNLKPSSFIHGQAIKPSRSILLPRLQPRLRCTHAASRRFTKRRRAARQPRRPHVLSRARASRPLFSYFAFLIFVFFYFSFSFHSSSSSSSCSLTRTTTEE